MNASDVYKRIAKRGPGNSTPAENPESVHRKQNPSRYYTYFLCMITIPGFRT